MTIAERYADICKISGLSEDIVRRVINAETQSIIGSLKRGERATLIGRCVIIPEIRSKLAVGAGVKNYIKLSATVAPSLKDKLEEISEFEAEVTNDDDNSGVPEDEILLYQIPYLE